MAEELLEKFGVVRDRKTTDRFKMLFKFLGVVVLIITLYSILFHMIMYYVEGRQFSWEVGPYFILTAMTTTGFGDYVFESTIGHLFTIIVMGTGIVVLLVALPLVFIQFFYIPWLEAQEEAKVPRRLSPQTRNHVVITEYEPVAATLIKKLKQFNHDYVILESDLQKAVELHDLGYKVMLGDFDAPETYRKLNIDKAAMLVANSNDRINANIAYTVREQNEKIAIVATANSPESVDILKLAGCTHVLQMGQMLGNSLARRTLGGSARVHVIGHFDKLVIGEAPAIDTPLVGKTLAESRIREVTGMNVLGFWQRGSFHLARQDSVINEYSVLVLVGSIEQMRRYDELFGIYHATDAPAVIIGGGRVGRAASSALADRQIPHKIIEKNPQRIRHPEYCVMGDAADLATLQQAGFDDAHTVMITSHEDEMNIYLTIYCRRLRPDIQIIARATRDRNISTLYRAGADFVMSYSAMGANAIYNALQKKEILMLAEGVNLFRIKVPRSLDGKKIRDARIREKTDCTIVALKQDDELSINPDPESKLKKDQEIILIGTIEAEKAFEKMFMK